MPATFRVRDLIRNIYVDHKQHRRKDDEQRKAETPIQRRVIKLNEQEGDKLTLTVQSRGRVG